VLSGFAAHIFNITGAGEKIPVFVKGDGHDSIGAVESFLDAIAVVDVNVDVEHAGVVLEQLEDSENDVLKIGGREGGREGGRD